MGNKIDSQSKEFIDRYKDDRGRGITEIPLTNTHPEHPHLVDVAEPNKIRTVKPADSLREEITEKTSSKKSEKSCERMVKCFGYFIVAIGIAITVSSTYVNVWNTIRYVRFTPPCIINVTASQISAS